MFFRRCTRGSIRQRGSNLSDMVPTTQRSTGFFFFFLVVIMMYARVDASELLMLNPSPYCITTGVLEADSDDSIEALIVRGWRIL